MPEIAVKQTLNDAHFRRGLAENSDNIRKWGKEAQQVFDSTRTPMEKYEGELARLNKLHKDGYLDAEAYARGIDRIAAASAKGLGNIRLPVAPGAAALAQQAGAAEGLDLRGIAGAVGGPIGGLAAGVLANPYIGIAAAAAAAGGAVMHLATCMHDTELAAEKVGVSMHVFQEMQEAAKQSGVNVDAMASTMMRFEKKVGEAGIEGGKTDEVLRSLGLSALDLMMLSPDQAFVRVAKAVSEMENRFERARVEVDLFGKAGAEMDLMLRKAAQGFESFDAPMEMASKRLAEFGEDSERFFRRWGYGWANMAGLMLIGLDAMGRFAAEQARLVRGPAFGEANAPLPPPEEAISPELKHIRLFGDVNKVKIEAMMKEAGELVGGGPEKPWEKLLRIQKALEGMGDRGKAALSALNEIADKLAASDEAKIAARQEAELAAKAAALQHAGDAAAKAWHDRLRAATVDADSIAASLIAGSKEFAGNMEAARRFVREVKAAEATDKMVTDAEKFEAAMRRELEAREGQTSREAQLMDLARRGLDETSARRMAGEIAELDARDVIRKRAERMSQMAPNLAYGSREAYDVMARSRAVAQGPDRQAQLQMEMNRRQAETNTWLSKIYNKTSTVAPTP